MPIKEKLNHLDLEYNQSSMEYPTYYDHYYADVATACLSTMQYGTRLVPRSAVFQNLAALKKAFRYVTDSGANLALFMLSPTKEVVGDVYNSVSPTWRSNLIHASIWLPWSFTAPWQDMVAQAVRISEDLLPPLIEATPGSGAYMNEVRSIVVLCISVASSC